MSFNDISGVLINPVQSRHTGGGGWRGSGRRLEGLQREFSAHRLEDWKRVKSDILLWPEPIFPSLSPLITVSDWKWWKGGGGVMKRWGDLGRKAWSHSMMWPCLKCNEAGNEPQGVSLFSSYFTPNPVDLLHLGEAYKYTWGICVHVYFSQQQSLTVVITAQLLWVCLIC